MVRRLGIAVIALLVLLASVGCYDDYYGDSIRVTVVSDGVLQFIAFLLTVTVILIVYIGIMVVTRLGHIRSMVQQIRNTSPAWRQHLSDEEERRQQERERHRQDREHQRQEEEEITKLSNWNPKKWMWYLEEWST